MKPALDNFVKKYTLMIQCIAHKLAPKGNSVGLQYEDLMSAGIIGLYNAIRLFKFKGIKFQTFLEWKVRGAILDAIREYAPLNRSYHKKIKNNNDKISTFVIPITEENEEIIFSQYISHPFEFVNETLRIAKIGMVLKEAIDRLSDKRKAVIIKYYFEEKSMMEIGKELGIAESTTSQRHTRAIQQLKEMLVYDGNTLFLKRSKDYEQYK